MIRRSGHSNVRSSEKFEVSNSLSFDWVESYQESSSILVYASKDPNTALSSVVGGAI